MPKKKTGYTWEQHDQLGLEIQTMYERLVRINTDLSNHYPKTGIVMEKGPKVNPVATTEKILNLFLQLRDELEKAAGKEHYGKVRADIKQLYYRGTREDHISNPQPIRPFPRE